jgi:2-polyprenyl-3-methyl-5-hydroxy-6-metoxy-1,4-benzoquinol methylase
MTMDDKAKIEHWDNMYDMPLENIPWEIKEPPVELVEAISSGNVKGKKALDIACGTGNYSFYLAQHCFTDVLGVDFSQKALDIARKNNEKLQLPVRFAFADVTKIADAVHDEQFDFIFDYSILHHLELGVTADYARQSSVLLG